MLFCSQGFLVFFAVVFVAYWSVPEGRARVLVLLGASIYFYVSWSAWLALVVIGSSTVDWMLARRMDTTPSARERRLLVTASVVGNLGLLAYFKYVNFFLQTIESTLRAAGNATSIPLLHVILPIGISFYTFEAINYAASVYRRQIAAERDLSRFLLFILFFPHLVAGPIVRANDFLPQTRRAKPWSWPRLHMGASLLVLGLFKKLVLADNLAQVADPVFGGPEAHTRLAAWSAALAFEGQCYCDFSGYSDMALGLAYLFGYRLAVNFDTPFLAKNVAERWRRWNMSLMGWFRDYVYLPLGGSRLGTARTLANILAVTALSGLWHGARVTFVVWGLGSGVLLVTHRLFATWSRRRAPALVRALATVPGTALRIVTTFLLISINAVFFRAESLPAAWAFLHRMAVAGGAAGPPYAFIGLECGLAIAAGHLAARSKLLPALTRAPAPVQGLILGGGVALALALAPVTAKTFVYFQF